MSPRSRSPDTGALSHRPRGLSGPGEKLRGLARAWARRRQGVDREPLQLHRRRIYILPTAVGVGFAISLFGMLLAAMNYNNSMAFALTFLLAGLGLVTMHWCHQNLSGVVVRSIRLHPTFAGRPAQLDLTLENSGQGARHDLEASCSGMRSRPMDLPPGVVESMHLELPTARRGRLQVDRVGLDTVFPFGLFRAWAWLHPACEGIVYPAPAEHAPPPPAGGPEDSEGQWDEHSGEEDFAGLREFRKGDSPRRIAWKAAARGGALPVKQFAGSPRGSAWLDWDSLPGMPVEQKLSVLCRWVLDAQAGGGTFGLRIPGTQVPPGIGPEHRRRCLSALALYGDGGEGTGDG